MQSVFMPITNSDQSAQADLSLSWMHNSEGTFCNVTVSLYIRIRSYLFSYEFNFNQNTNKLYLRYDFQLKNFFVVIIYFTHSFSCCY